MAIIVKAGHKNLYACSECGFKYADMETAEKCENWCRNHKSCNSEIVKKAILELEHEQKSSS
ncbi:MAG: hypothetical protein Q8Q17_00675 [bacterium]|nr:hypothetical protein [bacterium]